MMKKFSLALLVALSTMAALATEYVGTYTVTTGTYSRNNKSVVVTKTGDDVYDVKIKNFTVQLMGEVHQVGDVTFYSMIGTTDEEGYVTVTGNTKLQLSQLVDMDDLGDLLPFGDVSSMITDQSYPVNLTARFNYHEIDMQVTTTVVISIMGFWELLNETVRVTFTGVSNDDPPVVYARGDVNGDGVVDISDVNAVINVVLERESADTYEGRANLTEGDTLIDIVDVNEVISLVIQQ